MTAEELYQKEFGNADSIPKESVIRLLKHFAKALKIEREQALRIHDVSKSCPCCDGTGYCEGEHYNDLQACLTCGGSGHVC